MAAAPSHATAATTNDRQNGAGQDSRCARRIRKGPVGASRHRHEGPSGSWDARDREREVRGMLQRWALPLTLTFAASMTCQSPELRRSVGPPCSLRATRVEVRRH